MVQQVIDSTPALLLLGLPLPLVLHLLDWPFLLFLAFIILLVILKKDLGALLRRPDISLSWGGRTISLRDLPLNLEKELDPLANQIEALDTRLKEMEKVVSPPGGPAGAQVAIGAEPRDRMLTALRVRPYVWQSLKSLADRGGITEQEAEQMLTTEPAVELDVGLSGRPVAALKERMSRGRT